MTGPAGAILRTLPKAHLHLHFTGSMRHTTLLELAAQHRLHLPDQLRGIRASIRRTSTPHRSAA